MNTQRELYPYNAYGSDGGLFGLHHSPDTIGSLNLDLQNYLNLQRVFKALCDRLGERTLSRMAPGNAIVTPDPVSPELIEYMNLILGQSEIPLILDVENTKGDDICRRILCDGRTMDQLKRWCDVGATPVLTPRTVTPSSIMLARELGIYHALKPPVSLPNGKDAQIINGVYPSLEYIEGHTESINNSKVRNYLMQRDIDERSGLDLNPIGDVAYDATTVLDICDSLMKAGKYEMMIKADLSVDGMGNLHINLKDQKVGQQKLIELSRPEQLKYIRQILRDKGIPIGPQAGVVVTEFLVEKVSDPSIEIYCPPKEWNILPFIYYSCGMIIENGGFAGTMIPDPMLGMPDHLKDKYIYAMDQAKTSALEFCRRQWIDGYVGICDCDIAICQKGNGQIYPKILEYNMNRETGGTASYHLRQRLGGGFVIARDSVKGPGLAYPIPELRNRLSNILYSPGVRKTGAIILGHRIGNGEGQIMSLVYGEDMHTALSVNNELNLLAQEQ